MMNLSRMLLLSLLVSNASLSAADWPQWRGPERNGRIETGREPGRPAGVRQLWKRNVGTGFSSLAIADGRLYTIGNREDEDHVLCLDLENGEPLWQHAYDEPLDPNLFEGGPTATPTVAGGRVYTISRQGDLYCFDAASGQVHWNWNVPEKLEWNVPTWGFAGSPLVVGDRVIVNAGSHGLCVNAGSGQIIWASDNSEDAGYSSPVRVRNAAGDQVLLMSAKSLHAVDLESGALEWSFPWITRYGINAADPIPVDERRLLVSSGYSKGTALLKVDGGAVEQLWRSRELRNQLAPGVLLDGHLYAVDGDTGSDPQLVCMEALSGEVKWREGGFGSATLIAVEGNLFVLSQEGELVVVRPSEEEFQPLVRTQVIDGKCWTPPAYAASSLFVRNAHGDVARVIVEEASR